MAGKLMHAVWYTCFGGGVAGLKHVEIPIPSPGHDEILMKIEAASINPIDWKIQDGFLRPLLPKKFPLVPLSDVAGEVVEVGPGVTNFKTGDKIVATLGGLSGGGGLADYAVAKESLTVSRPPEVPAADGACLGIAACAALHSLTVTGGLKLEKTEPRTNVLITAASGGVGHYAVQLAKLGNTHVTATCGARNIDFVKNLGADEVLDYKTPEGAALKSPSGQKYDLVVNCTTGIPFKTFEPNPCHWEGGCRDVMYGRMTLSRFYNSDCTCINVFFFCNSVCFMVEIMVFYDFVFFCRRFKLCSQTSLYKIYIQ
ncbi:putative NADPH:quinone reductase [Helianthus annuus]|nr:putative NADPH:quinone reductase [Helianthus annuus]